MHAGLTFCVEAIPQSLSLSSSSSCRVPLRTFASGGSDNVAKLWTASGSFIAEMKGHDNCVNSVSTMTDGRLLTGSWDGKCRVWRDSEIVAVLGGHEHATEVLGLPTGEIVTASANKSIFIFKGEKMSRRIENAHAAPIRKLVVHPLGFASCGNDGFVNVWSNSGEKLLSIAAHVNRDGSDREEFCYGMCVIPSDDGMGIIVTCGEDGTARVFSSDGMQIQSIQHAGSVRSVKALPNGDFVTVCSDCVARVFSRDPARHCDAKTVKDFATLQELAKAAGMQSIDPSTLPGLEALKEIGDKPGAIRMVNVPGKGAMVYSWNAEEKKWDEVGEALGVGSGAFGSSRKEVVEGTPCDVVTDVFVNESTKVKLGFNRDDEPEDVANRFCTRHNLPEYMREQIIEHLTPLVSQSAIRARKMREAAEDANTLQQVPSWTTGGYHMYTKVQVVSIRKHILSSNASLAQQEQKCGSPIDYDIVLSDADMKVLDTLLASVASACSSNVSAFADAELHLMLKMLLWPCGKLVVPVLDAYRALMCHHNAVRKLGMNREAQLQLLSHVGEVEVNDAPTNWMLALKSIANFVAKRIRTVAERTNPGAPPEDVAEFVGEALELLSDAVGATKPAVGASYVMCAHNVVRWLGQMGVPESPMYDVIAPCLFELLDRDDKFKNKTVFYALLTIGSVGIASPTARQSINERFTGTLSRLSAKYKMCENVALRQVCRDIDKIFVLE